MNFCSPLIDLLKKSGHDHVFLFLDYDGTLAEFAPNPDIVLPNKEIIQLLTRLSTHPKVELAVVSGRRLGHIRELVPINGVWLAGSYGIELVDPDGREIDLLSYNELRPRLEKVKPVWETLVHERKNFYLEDKGWSIAIHANGENQKEVDFVIKTANEIDIPKGFILQGNDHFVELCPPTAEKGNTVKYLMDQTDQKNSLPVFIGDDDRDESAFEAIEKLGGIGVLISDSPRKSYASCYLENPKMVRRWLTNFLVYLLTEE